MLRSTASLSNGIVIDQSSAVSATISAPFAAPGCLAASSSDRRQWSPIAPATTSRMPAACEGVGRSPSSGIEIRVANTGVSERSGIVIESGAIRIDPRNSRLATQLSTTEASAGAQ